MVHGTVHNNWSFKFGQRTYVHYYALRIIVVQTKMCWSRWRERQIAGRPSKYWEKCSGMW